MAESKIELLGRLRREGRWPGEAETFKNTALKEFKAKGVKNASDAAWDALGTAFPPLPTTTIPRSEPKPDAPAVAEGPVAEQDQFGPLDADDLDDLDVILSRLGFILDQNPSFLMAAMTTLICFHARDPGPTLAAIRSRWADWRDKFPQYDDSDDSNEALELRIISDFLG